jgi:fibronectin type III domain protein
MRAPLPLTTWLVLGLAAPTGAAQVSPSRTSTITLTTLAAPAGVTVTATKTGIAVGWQSVVLAASYEILRAPDATSAAITVGRAAAGVLSFIDQTMAASGPAWYQVVAVASDGRRAASVRVQLVTSTTATLTTGTAPTAFAPQALTTGMAATAAGSPPSGLRATTTPTSIFLSWTCPTGPSGYDVYAAPRGGTQVKLTAAPIQGPCIQDLQANPTITQGMPDSTPLPTYSLSYLHSGLTPGSTFTYVVRALYSNGTSAASTAYSASASLLPAPGGFTVTASGRWANLQWQAVTGATGYQVFRKLAGQSAFQQLATAPASATGYSDQTILAPGQHQYSAQAVNGLPAPTATLSMPAWPAPSGFVGSSAGHTVNLSWKPVTGVQGYLVYRQLQGETGFKQVTPAPQSATTYQDNNLLPAQRDNYYVRAVEGDATPAVSVVPGSPVGLGFEAFPGNPSVDFRWGGTDDATTVQVLRAATQGGTFSDVTQAGALKNWARSSQGQVGATQYFKVSVTYYAIGQAESDVVAVTIPPALPPITNVRGTPSGAYLLKLSWDCYPGATSYRILRQQGTAPASWITYPGSTAPLNIVNGCSWDDPISGLAPYGYNYTIVASNGGSGGTSVTAVAP